MTILMIIKRKDIKTMTTLTNKKSIMITVIKKFTIIIMINMRITTMKAINPIAVIAQTILTRERLLFKKGSIRVITITVREVTLMITIRSMIMSMNMIMKHME